MKWHTLEIEALRGGLRTDLEHGLKAAEAGARLARHGPNALPEQRGPSALSLFLGQFSSLIVWVLGVSPLGLVSFEIGLLATAQFQHSNLRVPEPYETIVRRILVTPNMHRIHHSTVRGEHNSNFSTILSVWDRLLGTYHMKVRQEDIRIGLLEYQDPRAVSLPRVVWMPFAGRCSRTDSANPAS